MCDGGSERGENEGGGGVGVRDAGGAVEAYFAKESGGERKEVGAEGLEDGVEGCWVWKGREKVHEC